jgi:hypothetical protein
MYHRYVDDILIVYNNTSSNIDDLLTKFNSLHPDIQFKLESETESRLNFLDLTIHRMQDKLQYDIYRKPTATDIMIHSQSCHPREHKWSGISYLVNRLNTYPLTTKKVEKNIIEHMLMANGFNPNILDNLYNQKRMKTEKEITQEPKKKWITFTYMGRETRYITKLFKKYNLNIAWRTNNTLEQHLTNSKHRKDIYHRCGVYKMKCMECGGAYIGLTGRNFRVRYKEHIRGIRNNKTNTGYANHILNAGHTYGPIEDTLQVLGIQNKGPYLNTLEIFHIY